MLVSRIGSGLVAAAVAVSMVTACSPGHSSPLPASGAGAADGSYGALPSFLPSSTIAPDSVLTGSAGRPALTTEGDSVLVRVGDSSVLASVAGPVVPGEGLPFQAPATTCTWTVILSGATSELAIAPADFTTLDHLGAVYHVGAVAGEPGPPAVLGPGQTSTFELRAVMPTGEGLMRWAPGGGAVVASWDFDVEND